MRRDIFEPEHDEFRATARSYFETVCVPHADKWEERGYADREAWLEAGKLGLLGWEMPEEYGGLGIKDFRYNAIVDEEFWLTGAVGIGLGVQNDILAGYFAELTTDEQKQRWLPGYVSGETITAIAMSEPGAGSDLANVRTSARRDGSDFIVNGTKTFISNGLLADLVVVVCRTDPDADKPHKGLSLLAVEAGMEGFAKGRKLDKIGQKSADTSELFFHDARVPITQCLGEENRGFVYLMSQLPQERLSIAIGAQAAAQRAFDEAVAFTKDRKAFGKTVFDFQNTRFTLAGLKTKLQVGWAHLDWAIKRHLDRQLTTAEASAAKLWHTEMLGDVADTALQLHGGAGYMNEYMVARLWRDARVTRIYGGTSEIMKEVVSRSI